MVTPQRRENSPICNLSCFINALFSKTVQKYCFLVRCARLPKGRVCIFFEKIAQSSTLRSLQLAHNSNSLASSSTSTASTARPTRIPPKTERTPARFSFFIFLLFFVYYPEYYSDFPCHLLTIHAQYTHNKRTIDGQYTHNKRTINALFLTLPRRMKIQSPPLHLTLYTRHSTPYTYKIISKCDFSCLIKNKIVTLQAKSK